MFTALSPESSGEWFAHLNVQGSSQSQGPIEFLDVMLSLEEVQGNSGCRMATSVRLYRHVSTVPHISARTFTKSGIHAVGVRRRLILILLFISWHFFILFLQQKHLHKIINNFERAETQNEHKLTSS
jgi:hypothetical protein